MPEATTAPKCRACIEQGIPGECTDPAHRVAPEIGPPRTTVLSPDWTAVGTRSNSSPVFLALRAEVESIIRESAHALIAGRAGGVAGTILATLAHRHGLRPGGSGTGEPDVDRARRALRAFIEHLDAAPSAAVLDALNSALLAYDPPPPEPPADLRDAIARALAAANDDGVFDEADRPDADVDLDSDEDVAWYRKLADAVLPAVQAHVAAEVERVRAEGAAEALRECAREIEEAPRTLGGPVVAKGTGIWLRNHADRIAAGETQTNGETS